MVITFGNLPENSLLFKPYVSNQNGNDTAFNVRILPYLVNSLLDLPCIPASN